MVAITATNSTTLSAQVLLNKARLDQAQRAADQAENNAKQLRALADQAAFEAQQSHQNVRKIANANRQAVATYGSPAEPSTAETPVKLQNFIENMYQATSEQRAASGNALKLDPNAAPVVNVQGQSTGRILNLST
jgi:hypothetical protein